MAGSTQLRSGSDFDPLIAVFSPGTPVELWRNMHFGSPAALADAASLADPEGDGVVNVAEYGLGTNPKTANGRSPWQIVDADNRIGLAFTRSTTATDLTIVVQAADSLDGPWTDLAGSEAGAPFAPLLTGVTVIESGAGLARAVEVHDLFPIGDPAHPRRFMRLQFSLP